MSFPLGLNGSVAPMRQRALAAAVALLAVPAIAAAQAAAPSAGQGGDAGGLFNGATQTQGKGQSLALGVSIAEAFDHLANAQGTVSDAPRIGESGHYTTGSADLRYGFRHRALQIGATAGSTGWYDPAVRSASSASYYGSAGFALQMRRRTQIFVNQSISYDPWFLGRLFPAVVSTTPGTDEQFVEGVIPDRKRGFTTYSTAASLSHGITRRGTLSLTGTFRKADLDAQSSQTIAFVRGRFGYGLTRYATLRLGYGYRTGDFGYKTGSIVSHDIDAGVDYSRPISFSRRTTISFSVGSTVMRRPLLDANTLGNPFLESPESTIGTSQKLQYSVTGDASLNHRIGRRWTARATYDRGVLFYEGIAQPVLSNAVRGSLEGPFSRRISLLASGAYTRGVSATIGRTAGFRGYTGNARIQYTFRKPWVVYGEYSYDGYDVSRDLQLVSGVPVNTQRSTFRAGLSLWLPLVGR